MMLACVWVRDAGWLACCWIILLMRQPMLMMLAWPACTDDTERLLMLMLVSFVGEPKSMQTLHFTKTKSFQLATSVLLTPFSKALGGLEPTKRSLRCQRRVHCCLDHFLIVVRSYYTSSMLCPPPGG